MANMNEPKKEDAKDQSKDPKKDLKHLINAQMEVFEHKNGRAPTLEEIMKELVEEPASAEEAVASQKEEQESSAPKILSYKIIYGMREKKDPEGKVKREQDPTNILFYHDEKNNRVYDTAQREWLNEKPAMMEHLPCREMEDSEENLDLRDAILHGVMDDEDYAKLSSMDGMLDDRSKRLYELTKDLKDKSSQLSAMNKSEDAPEQVEVDGMSEMEAPVAPSENDALSQIMSGAEVAPEEEEDLIPTGENLLEEIDAGVQGSGVERRIRSWIREELEMMKDEVRAEMWTIINSSLQEAASAQPMVEGEAVQEQGLESPEQALE